MAEVLNAIPLPGVTERAPEGIENLLYSTENLVKVGFTFAESATAGENGILTAGTIIGRVTAKKKAGEYDKEATDGREVAIGVLLDNIDISNSDQLANVALGGEFLNARIIGLDSVAIEALGAVVVTLPDGTEILRF